MKLFSEMLMRVFDIRRAFGLLAVIFGLAEPSLTLAQSMTPLFEMASDVPVPSAPNAQEPSIVAHDGSLYLSWTEPSAERTRIMMAVMPPNGVWSEARVVHQGRDIFVNWADFAGIAVFDDGTIAVHWLRKVGPSGFDYQVEIALSEDEGRTWSGPLIPHEDRSKAQHGFVSMLPAGPRKMAIVWLDGRAYGTARQPNSTTPDAMQLRATLMNRDGSFSVDTAVDVQTCSCCQTDLAATVDGTILAAYRDRTHEEIRDISIARLTADGWTQPTTVHDDKWELAGCPVNGPAIDATGTDVAVAWFTAAHGTAAVKIAFSDDGGQSFASPLRIDQGQPVGRVDLELLSDGAAVVSWVEWVDDDEVLMLCRVTLDFGCDDPVQFVTNTASASVNFPRIAQVGQSVYIAWTQPGEAGDSLKIRSVDLVWAD